MLFEGREMKSVIKIIKKFFQRLETQAQNHSTWFLISLKIELGVETVNLLLSGTVHRMFCCNCLSSGALIIIIIMRIMEVIMLFINKQFRRKCIQAVRLILGLKVLFLVDFISLELFLNNLNCCLFHYCSQIQCIQIKCYHEIISIGHKKYQKYNLPWFRSLSW